MGTDRADPLEQYSLQPADVSNTPLNTHTPHTNSNIKQGIFSGMLSQ